MGDCSVSDEISEICWFCKKGRHKECMKEMPVNAKSEGPHECTFDTKLISCKCPHGKWNELNYDECIEEQCIRLIQEMLQVENIFQIQICWICRFL